MWMPLEEECIPELDYEIKNYTVLKSVLKQVTAPALKLVCWSVFSPGSSKIPPQDPNRFSSVSCFFPPVVSDVVFSPRSQKCNVEPELSKPQSPLSHTQVTAHFLFLLLWSVFFAGAPYNRSSSCPGVGSVDRCMERCGICGETDREKKERGREAERERIC